MAQNNTKNLNKIFSTWLCNGFWINRMFWDFRALLGVGHQEPESAVWHCQSSTKTAILGGELGTLGPEPFSISKNCRSDTTNCNFRPRLNFPILTCQTTSQPINFKNAQHFPLLIIRASGMYPIPLGCGVYPIRQGLSFYAPQPRATPMMSPSWGQSLQFKVHALPDQNKTAKRRPNPKHDSTWISQ